MLDPSISLQEQYAPKLECFGCGPKNAKGLQIKSFVQDNGEVICEFLPDAHHVSYDGMMNGGILGSLLDCHMNWTAAWHLMEVNQLNVPPCTVTAKYTVEFKAPTPLAKLLRIVARVVDSSERKAVIEAELGFEDAVTATGSGIFVSVKPGHPAYHRW